MNMNLMKIYAMTAGVTGILGVVLETQPHAVLMAVSLTVNGVYVIGLNHRQIY